MQIVKVQIPLSSNLDPPRILVYNQNKSIYCLMPMQQRFLDELRTDLKGYYELEGEDKATFKIGERVAAQDW